jgi:outer membrane protein
MRRMAFTLAVVGLILAIAASPSADAQTALKIGYINSQAIYEEAPGAKEAQASFEQEMATYRSEVQRLGEELQTMIAQYEQQQMSLPAEARQAREAAIREKDGAYRERVSRLENEAGRRQQELVAPIMRQINEVIERLRREGSYSLIFDIGPGSNIIAADPDLNLTDEVVRRLKAGGG